MRLGLGLGLSFPRYAGGGTPAPTPAPPPAPTLADVSRPALVTNEFYNAFGDSTTFGVGSATGSDWPAQFRTIATGPTDAFNGGTGGNNGASIVEIGNGGIASENTASITARVTGLSPTYAAQLARHHFYAGGLNDYNPGVPGWARDWPAQVKTNYITAAAAVTGGKDMFAFLAPQENNAVSGARYGADHRFHALDMAASYGRKAVDTARYLRFVRELEAPTGTADASALAMGQIPYKYRGNATVDFADVDFAHISGAGVPSDLNYPEGTIYWNTTARSSYRKLGASGSGSWVLTDTKHFSKWGNVVLARMAGDIAAALEGFGPPFVPPHRLRIATDAANGAVVGQLAYTGTTTAFSLRTLADGPVTDFAISASGQITKATGSALTEGVTSLAVVAKNANGVLASPVDIFVTRASTETAPTMRAIASPGLAISGRDAHGMADGKQISGAFWINTSSLAATNQLALLSRTSAPTTPLSVSITTSGVLRITATDSASTLVANISASGGTVTTGTNFWLLFALDFATNTRSAYLNETALTVASITNGANLQLADSNPLFLSARAPFEFDDGLSQLIGSAGFMMLTDGYIDWSNATNRRALYGASSPFTPATRTPYSAIGGVTPRFELWGGKGDWLWGSPDGSYGPKLLSMSHKARTIMS